jgi:uncharacterized membrane protein YdjX (TVP38/TMEM64 family)
VERVNREEDKLEVREGPKVAGRPRRVQLYTLLGLLLLVIGYALWSFHALPDVYQGYRDLIQLFTDRKRLRALVLSYGDFAPLVFITLQVLQVIIAVIPGEATGFLGGFLFGAFPGFLYSSIGLSVGSLLAFGLARWLGLRFVRRMVRPELYQKFAFLQEPRGIVAVFFLFLIPGFPKDYLSYILGVSPIPLWAFFLVTSLGRMPGTWFLSIQGAKFHAEESYSLVLFFVISAFLVLLAYIYRARIMEFVRGHKADAP